MQYIIGNVLAFGGAFVMLVGLGGANSAVQRKRTDWFEVVFMLVVAMFFGGVMVGGMKLAGWF